jgi:hypothetical protein
MDEMKNNHTRRDFILRGVIAGAGLAVFGRKALAAVTGRRSPATGAAPIPMVVYSDPNCGCCGKWVTLMDAAGFQTSVQRTTDMGSIKKRYGIPASLVSCHTALVGGYKVEGHVPADLIKKMLTDKPKIAGLAVAGMVTGSPGMEGPNPQHYDVTSFDATGKTSVYARR